MNKNGENKKLFKAKAPYNFITLENKVLNRYDLSKEIPFHSSFRNGYNTGEIIYEIETETPLHISDGKKDGGKPFKNPLGQYVIPANTIRGMTRYNASIFSLSSVKNSSRDIEKEDMINNKFYYRNFASNDNFENNLYKDLTGMKQSQKGKYKFTLLLNVKAGYMRKSGSGYTISPAVEIKSMVEENSDKEIMKSYSSIHELELRIKKPDGIRFLYREDISIEDLREKIKNKSLKGAKNKNYKPYYTTVKYNIDVDKPIINNNGKYKGVLANSNFIENKIHHYLIFEENKSVSSIIVTKEQADTYIEDLIYTKKMDKTTRKIDKKFEYYDLPKEGEVKPVFFIYSQGQLIFGFTPYLRFPAKNSIYTGIPKEHLNFNGKDWVDSIFGYKSFKSRVSFLDAVINDKSISLTQKYKVVLEEPKASWYKGYLKQRKTDGFETYNRESFEIRGRKFYWMKDGFDEEAIKNNLPGEGKSDKIITEMICIREKEKFSGSVRFENLTDEELGLLMYSLKQGDTEGIFNIGKMVLVNAG